jgi:hypothetical protein
VSYLDTVSATSRPVEPNDTFRFADDSWEEMETIVARAGGDLTIARRRKGALEIRVHAGIVLHRTGYGTAAEWNATTAKLRQISDLSSKLYGHIHQLLAEDEHGLPSTRSWLDSRQFAENVDSIIVVRSKAEAMLKARGRARGKQARDFIVRQFAFFWRDVLGLKVGTGRRKSRLKNSSSSQGNHALAFTIAGCRDVLLPTERSEDAILGVFRNGLPPDAHF